MEAFQLTFVLSLFLNQKDPPFLKKKKEKKTRIRKTRTLDSKLVYPSCSPTKLERSVFPWSNAHDPSGFTQCFNVRQRSRSFLSLPLLLSRSTISARNAKKSGITLKRGREGKIVEKKRRKKRTRGNIGVFPGIKISYCLNRGFSETISRAGVPTSMQRDSGRA